MKNMKRVRVFQPLVAFSLTVLMLLGFFVFQKVFPFGNRSFMYMDMYHQYVPFMTELWNALRDAEESYFSYRVGIGSDFTALYVYYLASPLHFLAFFIPKEYCIELVTYLCVFKLGVCSFSACFYLQEKYKAEGYEKICFALLYSTCGFMCAYNWNIMWLDACMLMPLVLLGLEKLVKEGKCGLYCVALAATIYTNYYIAILLCVFLVFYFIALLCINGISWKKLVNFGIFSLLAGGMAAVLLLPEVCAILQTSFGNSTFPKEMKAYFSIFDVISRHGMCVSPERGLDHWPNIYCGTIAFLLLPCFLVNKEISNRKKFFSMLLMALFLFSFSTNILEFLWHGFNYPDSLPARQSFIYCFLVLVLCYEALLHLDALEKEWIIRIYGAGVVFLVMCEKLVDQEMFGRTQMLVTLLFLTIHAIILYFMCKNKECVFQRWLGVLFMVAIIGETGINSYNTSLGTTSRDSYVENLESYAELSGRIREQRGEESIYRMEKFSKKTKNDGILGNYPSASLFSSTLNSKVSKFYEKVGMRYSKVFYSFDGATPLTAALLNVDYMFNEEKVSEDEPSASVGAEENEILNMVDRVDNITLYEYQYKLPFGYVAPYGYDFESDLYSIKLQNKMVHNLGIEEDLFVSVQTQSGTEGKMLYAREKGIYYGVLKSSGIKKIKLTGKLERTYPDLKKQSILYVGELESDDRVTFKVEDGKENTSISMEAYYLNKEVLEKVIEKLSMVHLENLTYDNTHIRGHLSLPNRGRLILSIALEEGWKVKVNGVETEPEMFGECFIALDLEAGEYDISLEFVPKGLKEGAVITFVSLTLFIGIMLFGRRKSYQQEKKTGISEEATEKSVKNEK